MDGEPYSRDLRLRVITAVEEDAQSCHEAARRYPVSASSAIKWVRAYRRTGHTQRGPWEGTGARF